jgi:hypothetical protein
MVERSSGENEKESGEDDNHHHRRRRPGMLVPVDEESTDEEGSEEDEAELDRRRRNADARGIIGPRGGMPSALSNTPAQHPYAQMMALTADVDSAKRRPAGRNGFSNAPMADTVNSAASVIDNTHNGSGDGSGEVSSSVEQQERSLFAGDEWSVVDNDENDDEDMTERGYLMIIEEQRRALELLMHELAEQKGFRDVCWANNPTGDVHHQEAAIAARADDYAILMRENERLRKGATDLGLFSSCM